MCIRLATFEDEEEAAVLATMARTRTGLLENTVFALLAPDGRQPLIRGTRNPHELFRGPQEMADTMRSLASRYRSREAAKPLPVMKSVRLALNVAACDGLPLVVAYGRTAADRGRVSRALARFAWAEGFRGRAVYAESSAFHELAELRGARDASGVLVVRPDAYGLGGQVVLQAPSLDAARLDRALAQSGLVKGDPRAHMHGARQQGAFWWPEVPVTDPHWPYR